MKKLNAMSFPNPLRIAILTIALMLATSLQADDRPVIRAGFIEFPPLAFTNDDGEAEGSFITLSERVADRAGYRIEWHGLPIGRVYLYLERGDIDMWPGSAGVPELARYTRETAFSPGSIRLHAYRHADTPAVSTIDDLQGNSLILIRGYTYFRLLDHLTDDPDTRITVAPNHRAAVRMLSFRRGDYLINFQSPMSALLDNSDASPGLEHDNLLSWPLTFVFSTSAPGTGTMIDDFNKAWVRLQTEGFTRSSGR